MSGWATVTQQQAVIMPRRSGLVAYPNDTKVSRAAIDAWQAKREGWMQRANHLPRATDVALTTTWDDLPSEMRTLVVERLHYEANDYRNKFQWFLSTFGFYFLSHTNKATHSLVSKVIPLVSEVNLLASLRWQIKFTGGEDEMTSDAFKSVTKSRMKLLDLSCLALAALAVNNPVLTDYVNAMIGPSGSHINIHVCDDMRSTGLTNSPAGLVDALDEMGYVGGEGLLTEEFIRSHIGLHTPKGELICSSVDSRGNGVRGALMSAFEGAVMGGHDEWALEIWEYLCTLGVNDSARLMRNVSAAHGRTRVFCAALSMTSSATEAVKLTAQRETPLSLAVRGGQVQMVRFILEDPALFTHNDLFACVNINQQELESEANEYVKFRCEAINSLLVAKMTHVTYEMWSTAPSAVRHLPAEIIDNIMDDTIMNGRYKHWPIETRIALLMNVMEQGRAQHAAKLLATMNAVPGVIRTMAVRNHSMRTLETLASAGAFDRFINFASECAVALWTEGFLWEGTDLYKAWQFLCDRYHAKLGGLPSGRETRYGIDRIVSLIRPDVRSRLPWLMKNGFELEKHVGFSGLLGMMISTPWEQVDSFDFLFTTRTYIPDVQSWSRHIFSHQADMVCKIIKRVHVDLRVPIDMAAFVQLAITRGNARLLRFLQNEMGAVFDAALLHAAIRDKQPLVSIINLFRCGCAYELDVIDAICAMLDADATTLGKKQINQHKKYMHRLRAYLDSLRQ